MTHDHQETPPPRGTVSCVTHAAEGVSENGAATDPLPAPRQRTASLFSSLLRMLLPRFPLSMIATLAAAATPTGAAQPDRATVLATMKRATEFMVDKVACQGGYVWTYLPDLSRRWGELEATPTMIWMQSGTASMGEGFLDAFHATGDEYYYNAAARVGDTLIATQHRSGGWNYAADFAGEESLRRWYETIGRNAWRLEEFQHYCGNATFDDQTTTDPARFLLRLYLEKREPRFRAALDRAIAFVLAAQYPMGGWPQRFPPADPQVGDGCPTYAQHVTLNDNVAAENLDFLILCHALLGDAQLAGPIRRGMDAFLRLQQPAPQAGWALQYTLSDLKPAAARTYEPVALATHTTLSCLTQLLRFHELTGDAKYLAPIPAALAWLDSVRLPAAASDAGARFPTFVELGTNQPLFLHRTGSNVVNGRYFADHDPAKTVGHYRSTRALDIDPVRDAYARAIAKPLPPADPGGAFRSAALPAFPRFHGGPGPVFLESYGNGADSASVERIVSALNAEGYWPTPLWFISNPYAGDGPAEIPGGDFASTHVGDKTDTSPHRAKTPVTGISIASYLRNMAVLIRHLEKERAE